MKIISLNHAMESAATAVYLDRQKIGGDIFDKAVAHHSALRLVADIEKGSTKNRHGFVSQFAGYDWQKVYEDAPHFVYFDFFRPAILNSCGRIDRGMEP